MNEFRIHFISEEESQILDNVEHFNEALGEICIGDFRERFWAPVDYWNKARYEQQWLDAAKSLECIDRVALMTAMVDPSTANYYRFWALYRDQNEVIAQEQLYILAEHPNGFDPASTRDYIEDRGSASPDDEYPVSEWRTTMDAVRRFAGAMLGNTPTENAPEK